MVKSMTATKYMEVLTDLNRLASPSPRGGPRAPAFVVGGRGIGPRRQQPPQRFAVAVPRRQVQRRRGPGVAAVHVAACRQQRVQGVGVARHGGAVQRGLTSDGGWVVGWMRVGPRWWMVGG